MAEQRLSVRDRFEKQDLPCFEADGKVGLLATVSPEGLPHITLITAMQALDDRRLIFGQFCEGRGKRYAEANPRVGFLIMTLDRRLWRGTALWTGKAQSGPEHELMNRKPMWRYNSYFGIHTVHYMDLVSVTSVQNLPMGAVFRGVLAASLSKGRSRRKKGEGEFREALNPWTRAFISRTGNLKFVAYVDKDGHPRIFPQLAATCADGRGIYLPGAEYPEELGRIPNGASAALFAMSLDMEDVLVRGAFRRDGRGGEISVDWVYNSMPPVAEQIFPSVDLADKVTAF